MVRSKLSRKPEVNAALKKGDASERSASWTRKAVLVSPTTRVTVATSVLLEGVSNYLYNITLEGTIEQLYLRIIGVGTAILRR